jgi:acylphosphatase
MDRHAVIETLKEQWLSQDDLSWLDPLDDQTLQALHDEVMRHASRLDEAQASLYRVMASTTKFMPNFVVAKMATSLDPYVVAQITRHLDSKAAAGIAKSLEPTFLGEIALHLDVAKINDIARATDIDRLVAVVERMGDRGFYHRLGELADAMDSPLLNKLTRWVRNRRDGSVEVWAEGAEDAVEALLADLARGPRMARVDGLDVRERAPEGRAGFEVRATT